MDDDRPPLEQIRDATIIASLAPGAIENVLHGCGGCLTAILLAPLAVMIVGTMLYYMMGPVGLVICGGIVVLCVVSYIRSLREGTPPPRT